MLLTKFENKSARVKGLSFHPTRPWILVSLHTGNIQLWDYRIPTMLDRFENHEGPVRGIDFHCQQPLFVSGGDDYKIKVWNHKLRKCLFTLLGHLDYIRTTYFHHEYPWILSASDDQTIRLWNWQSRHCISIIPGHNYYVMSARFHPTEDLIISASLDQTVRIWDFSGLRKKNVYSSPEMIQTQLQRASGTPDLFGHADTIVKFVLEGHERGVNWAVFHPSMSLAASSGDDRQIKLWRMNESRVWELDTCRGHHNNVTCVLFHPTRDIMLSTSEDKTLKIWDLSKRICIHTVRQENSRFWILANHPNLNIFAAGHDNGFLIFKLERERPVMSMLPKGDVIYVKDNSLRILEVNTQKDSPYASLKSIHGSTIDQISYHHGASCMIVLYRSSTNKQEGQYQLVKMSINAKNATIEESKSMSIGLMAFWVSWNKIAVLVSKGKIVVKSVKNEEHQSIDEFPQCDRIFQGIESTLLVKEHSNLYLFDLVSNKRVASITVKKAKHVIWSDDRTVFAVLTKTGFKIVSRDFRELQSINENSRVKSGIFTHNNEVFIYTTLTHVKYALISGSTGVLRTISIPLYILRCIDNRLLICLNRSCAPLLLLVDTTEYQFKLALENERFDEVVNIVRRCDLIGQSTISYLYKKGYPEIALRFVDNKQTRYGLAIECGDLQAAFSVAREIDQPSLWSRLAKAAMQQGKLTISEVAYQKLRRLDKLTILYILTGNYEKLDKLSKIVDVRNDYSTKYALSLFTGNIDKELSVLEENEQLYLAYLASIVNGQTEMKERIALSLNTESMTQLNIKNTTKFKPLKPLHTIDSDFPFLISNQSFLNSLTDAAAGRGDTSTKFDLDFKEDENDIPFGSAWQEDLTSEEILNDVDGFGKEDTFVNVSENDDLGIDEGWECDDISANAVDIDTLDEFIAVGTGVSLIQREFRKFEMSALNYIQDGKFSTAMKILHETFGVVKFKPYKEIFLKIYAQCRMSLKSVSPFLEPCICYPVYSSKTAAMSQLEDDDNVVRSNLREFVSIDLLTQKLQRAYMLTTKGKFSDSIKVLQGIVLTLPFIKLSSKHDRQQFIRLREVCQQYILGQQIELARRRLASSDPANAKRICELAVYFANCDLRPKHKILAWKTALNLCFQQKNFKSALVCGRNLLSLGPNEEMAASTRKIMASAESAGAIDRHLVDYDELNPFDVCAASYTPIYRGSPVIKCPLCFSCYLPKFKGELCRLTQAAEIGLECNNAIMQ
ncbi:hypothetical protein GJ496_005925 [Pomphorhynchus laevis]|nr:hypothetical protein GJ496_005925 [Pomphorhynchus laevis]